MVAANELRIGNWVKYTNNKDLSRVYHNKNIIVGIDILNDIDHIIRGQWFEPIPLSPEVLEKCGFVLSHNSWYTKDYFTDCNEAVEEMRMSINSESNRFAVFNTDDENAGPAAMSGKIVQSLHQLQNLYFALVGEELEVNL